MKNKPGVGVGMIVVNKDGKILIGKRIGSHASKYSIPGGRLELGETFEETAIRELKEETNITIKNPKVIAVTNNLETYREENIHHISVIVLIKGFSGKLKNMESGRCERWLWCDPRNLPSPHFDASRLAVECYLKNKFYVGIK